jgi:peptidyl-prolyl cis-trans isomerase D
MESFRKVIRGWLGKLLLVLFLLPLALVGIEGYFSGGGKDTVKSVNGQDISEKELETLTKSLKEQYMAYANGDETLLNQEFIKNKALDTLISRNLILQQAEKLGISLSDAQLEQMIAQQPSFQQDGKFSEALYANYLQSVGMTSQALIVGLRQDHALKMLSAMFLDNALVSKVDIQQVAQLQTEQRQLHLASVKLDDYKKSIQVTDAELNTYYQKHQNLFKQVANVDVDYVELSPNLVTTTVEAPTAAELQQAYQEFVTEQKNAAPTKVQHILVTASDRSDADAKKRAEEVVAKIKAGTSFADAAKQYSEDTESKNNAGLIASYAKGVFDASFDQAVDKLTAGQVSAPVKTQYGYHVILKQATNVQVPSFEAEKSRLIAEVTEKKKANIFSDTVNSLNDLVVSSDALDVVTQEVKAAKIISQRHVTVSNKLPILSDANVKAKLFNDDVKNGDRNASSSIQLANGNTVWVKVRNYHAAGVQSFAEAKTEVKALYVEQKAFDAAKAKIQDTLAQFSKQPASAVVAKSGLNFVPAGTFMRSQGLKREIERAAFSVMPPKAGHWSVTTAKLPNELVVVAVAEVNTTTANALNDAQLQELTKLYQQLRGQQELDDYTRYLKAKAKIK